MFSQLWSSHLPTLGGRKEEGGWQRWCVPLSTPHQDAPPPSQAPSMDNRATLCSDWLMSTEGLNLRNQYIILNNEEGNFEHWWPLISESRASVYPSVRPSVRPSLYFLCVISSVSLLLSRPPACRPVWPLSTYIPANMSVAEAEHTGLQHCSHHTHTHTLSHGETACAHSRRISVLKLLLLWQVVYPVYTIQFQPLSHSLLLTHSHTYTQTPLSLAPLLNRYQCTWSGTIHPVQQAHVASLSPLKPVH